jgi:hypothetical protein
METGVESGESGADQTPGSEDEESAQFKHQRRLINRKQGLQTLIMKKGKRSPSNNP